MTQAAGQVYAKELTPTDLLQNPVQGPTPTLVSLSAFGACPNPTGELFSVGVPVMSPQMFDSYGLGVPGGPVDGVGYRVARSTATSKRYITNSHTSAVKRLPYVSSNQAGNAIGISRYGNFAYTDENGVTHQPPGTRDPVVNRDKFDVLYDGKTIKLDASTNQLYADILGLDAPGSASDTIPAGPLTAGHAIIIIPGPGPSDPPTITMVAGSGIDQPATFQWAFSITRYGKETGLSPAQSGTTDATYGHASIDLPDLPTGDVGTAYNLYRKDTATGADGSIDTKFAYTTTTGAVLITDASTGAVEIKSGPESGLWLYTVVAANGNIHAGDEYLFNPQAYVVVGDPPVPIDPRTGSHLRIDVAPDGSYVFTASDTGIFNAVTGKVTFPPGSPLNATVFKTVAAGLSPVAQTYVDVLPNASLGAVYARGQQTVNVKLSTNTTAPYLLSTALPGVTPAQYPDNAMEFSDVTAGGNDGLKHRVKWGTGIDADNQLDLKIRTSPTIPAVGAGDQTARAFPCYDGTVYNDSAIDYDPVTGAAFVKIDGVKIVQDASGALTTSGSGGGGGGGGTGSAVAFSTDNVNISLDPVAFPGYALLSWGAVGVDHGGWVTAGTDSSGTNIIFPVTGTYGVSVNIDGDTSVGNTGEIAIGLHKNGSPGYQLDFPVNSISTVENNVNGQILKVADFVAGDQLEIWVYNQTSDDFNIDGGSIDIWLIETGGTGLGDGQVINTGTATGTKIGTSSTNKMGFYGATPIIQPTSTGGSGVSAGATYTATEQAMLEDVYIALRSLGLLD
jgi:hypothetical protein